MFLETGAPVLRLVPSDSSEVAPYGSALTVGTFLIALAGKLLGASQKRVKTIRIFGEDVIVDRVPMLRHLTRDSLEVALCASTSPA